MIHDRSRLPGSLSRRRFVQLAGVSGLGLFAGARHPALASDELASTRVAEGTWGHIDRLEPGVWAVVSTPLAHDDWMTLCNGGIVAGKERILVVESFARPEGARLVAETARELTGRWPTDVLVTHYHGDHANGLEGFAAEGSTPTIWMTQTTRDLVLEADGRREDSPDALRGELLAGASLIGPDGALSMDLGGVSVKLHPRRGHTASDISVELDEQGVIFGGDLIWNKIFPNFRDTLPTALSESVGSLRREAETAYVPGHGPLASGTDVTRFVDLIDLVEAAARRAIEGGKSAAQAAAEYRLPQPLEDWHLFRDNYFEVAIGSWYKELGIDPAG
jgi:glyoxylase-like metal-dependent hydrolase (beta-lactamase superfamily II)